MWDAWDVDGSTATQRTDLDGRRRGDPRAATRRGPAYASATRRSPQQITLRPGAKQVDIDDRGRLARAGEVPQGRPSPSTCTPTTPATRRSSGTSYRPTHTNTSWDAAKFEICAHRWVHVEEAGYGVALVNDSTYGHDVTRHVRDGGGTNTTVRLSLLRAPRYPDPDTDQGAPPVPLRPRARRGHGRRGPRGATR